VLIKNDSIQEKELVRTLENIFGDDKKNIDNGKENT